VKSASKPKKGIITSTSDAIANLVKSPRHDKEKRKKHGNESTQESHDGTSDDESSDRESSSKTSRKASLAPTGDSSRVESPRKAEEAPSPMRSLEGRSEDDADEERSVDAESEEESATGSSAAIKVSTSDRADSASPVKDSPATAAPNEQAPVTPLRNSTSVEAIKNSPPKRPSRPPSTNIPAGTRRYNTWTASEISAEEAAQDSSEHRASAEADDSIVRVRSTSQSSSDLTSSKSDQNLPAINDQPKPTAWVRDASLHCFPIFMELPPLDERHCCRKLI